MPQGSGSTKRSHNLAKQAYRLRMSGHTNRQIAEVTGKTVKQVPSMVSLGERLIDGENKAAYHGDIDGDFSC